MNDDDDDDLGDFIDVPLILGVNYWPSLGNFGAWSWWRPGDRAPAETLERLKEMCIARKNT
jgi:hypothetical protein